MNDENERSVASAGSGLHRVQFTLHWSADTEKGRQRICASVTLSIPFVPAVGQCIQLADDLPSPKIKEVVWRHWDETFSAHCRMRLKDWDSKLFESLLDDIRNAGLGMEPKLFNDNWMYESNSK
jgi:hypothetical protein